MIQIIFMSNTNWLVKVWFIVMIQNLECESDS
jgi:hypothetical protein